MTNIYIIRNKETGQGYVGKTIKPIEVRFAEHCVCTPDNHTLIDGLLAFNGIEFLHHLRQSPSTKTGQQNHAQ